MGNLYFTPFVSNTHSVSVAYESGMAQYIIQNNKLLVENFFYALVKNIRLLSYLGCQWNQCNKLQSEPS